MAVKTEGWGVTATPGEIRVSKGFLQSEVSGEVGVLEGRRSGRSFGEVWDEVFGEVFGLVLLQHSEQKEEDFRKNSSPKFPTGKNSEESSMTRFCRATPTKIRAGVPAILFYVCVAKAREVCASLFGSPGFQVGRRSGTGLLLEMLWLGLPV